MKLFYILVRCLLVGAICIVASALYIVNAHAATQQIVVEANCPYGYTDGLDTAYGNRVYCYKFEAGVTTAVLSDGTGILRDTVKVRIQGQCDEAYPRLKIIRIASGLYAGQCFNTGFAAVTPGAMSLSTDFTAYNVAGASRVILMVANAIVFILGMGFGWRQSIAPPRFLMD